MADWVHLRLPWNWEGLEEEDLHRHLRDLAAWVSWFVARHHLVGKVPACWYRHPGLTDELSWLPVDEPAALAPTTDLGVTGLTVWSGSFTRPKAPGTYRVAVWEQQSWPSTVAPGAPISSRVVFFDAFPI